MVGRIHEIVLLAKCNLVSCNVGMYVLGRIDGRVLIKALQLEARCQLETDKHFV